MSSLLTWLTFYTQHICMKWNECMHVLLEHWQTTNWIVKGVESSFLMNKLYVWLYKCEIIKRLTLDLWNRSIRCLRNIIHWNLITTFILRNVMWFLLQLIDHNIHESNEVTAAIHKTYKAIGKSLQVQLRRMFCQENCFSNWVFLFSFSALVSINYDNIQLLCGDKLLLDVCWRMLPPHSHCNDLFNW